jgi:mono/diheme cytochrome c family protein
VIGAARPGVGRAPGLLAGWGLLAAALLAVCGAGCQRGPGPEARAASIYARRCAGCHGETGAGDGPAGLRLEVRPRALDDARWQAGESDARIRQSILRGSVSLGLSMAMPPSADLAGDPEALAALVRKVRAFARQAP